MRRLALGIALVALTVLTACGGDDTAEPGGPTSDAPAEESSAPPSETSTEAPSSEPADSGSGDATALTGTVGTEEDPDAFEITLVDDSGQPVTTLPAGEYTIDVSDLSSIHHFHLTGGALDESTTVEEITDMTWEVTLEPGEYSFRCDPHPPMSGEFTVT